jgi:hypothetical protein
MLEDIQTTQTRKSRTSGITHVLVSEISGKETNLRRIYEKPDIDNTLLHRNIEHIAQADGTPFTTSPLLELIGENSNGNLRWQNTDEPTQISYSPA